ncbi:hypothetical protein QTP88_015308 [Uroleucon formosanum]
MENVADSISSDAEHDELTEELLICPVKSEDFSEEFIPYPREKCKRRDSDTDSKFELRNRFSDLRTGVLESPAIATVSTGKTKVTDVPLPAIELEFALGTVVALLDFQAARIYVKLWVSKKCGRSFTEELEIVRMADGRTREITEFSEFWARIVNLEVSFKATVLDDLIGDIFLDHDFLVKQQVAWDYSGCIIHPGKERRVSVSWRNPVTPVTVGVDLATARLLEGEYGVRVKEVLCQYMEVFSKEVGRTRVIEHQIRLKDPNPVALNAYGYSREKNEVIAQTVRDMEKQGFVEPSISPWAAPVVLVKKKDGARRFCVDYRRLNMQTESDAHPIPDLHDMVRGMGVAKIYSTMNLNLGYWQVGLSLETCPLTAFRTQRGLLQFRVMSFGLKNAPAIFCCLVNEVFHGLVGKFVLVCLDDIVVYSESPDQYLNHLQRVLERLQSYGLSCQPKKCTFGVAQIKFLVHVVDGEGIDRKPEKLTEIQELLVPKKTKDVLRVLDEYCGTDYDGKRPSQKSDAIGEKSRFPELNLKYTVSFLKHLNLRLWGAKIKSTSTVKYVGSTFDEKRKREYSYDCINLSSSHKWETRPHSGILPRKGQLSPKTPVPCHYGILQKYVQDGVASSSRRTLLDFQSKEMAKIEKYGISVRRGTISESEAANYLSRYTNETVDL